MKKNPHERLMDAQLHLKMAREGPLDKADKRVEKAMNELKHLMPG